MPEMHGMAPVTFTLHHVLTSWNLGPFSLCVLAVLIALGGWYLRAEWQLARRGRRWSPARRYAFLGGIVSVELAFQSPVADFAGTYFQAHVIQHLILMVIAPPLLALGAPSTLLLQTTGRRTKERWLRVLRSGPFAVLSHPLTVWCLYYGAMFAFFLTGLINLAMTHMALMDAINLVFLLGGTLFWWPMVGVDPIIHWKMGHGARMLNILLGSGIEAFLGVAILNESHPAASMYTLASTHSGGALLWVSTEFVTVLAFLPIYLQWMHSEDRVAAREDRRSEADLVIPAMTELAETWTAPTFAPRSAWEAEWMARTGSVPLTRRAAAAPQRPAD